MNKQAKQQSNPRTMTGKVVSDKMNKTVVVAIQRQVRHELYGKIVRKISRLKAHDESNECHVGDTVIIQSCRPISRDKSWKLLQIVTRADKAVAKI